MKRQRSTQDIRLDAARRLLDTGTLPDDELDELFALQNDAQARLRDRYGESAAADDDLAFALDVLHLLSNVYPDDESYPWSRAALLSSRGRPLEAAQSSFARPGSSTTTAPVRAAPATRTDGPARRGHAARCLAVGGEHLAAAQLLSGLHDDDRESAAKAVEAALAAVDRHPAA